MELSPHGDRCCSSVSLPEKNWEALLTVAWKPAKSTAMHVTENKQTRVFSILLQLSAWHCSYLLLKDVLLGAHQSISPACLAHSSKPITCCSCGPMMGWQMERQNRQTDGQTNAWLFHRSHYAHCMEMCHLSKHVSFVQICDCRIFHLLQHFSHMSAKCAYRILLRINWHIRRQF